MKKFFLYLVFLIIIILSISIIFLSTKGYETKKFNTLINNKIKKIENNLDVKIDKILIIY